MPLVAHGQSSSEEVLRRKFLKARQQMRTVPKSAPEPVATPQPAQPEETPVVTARAEPNIRAAEPQVRPAEPDVRPAERSEPPARVQEEPVKPAQAPAPKPTPTPEPKAATPPPDVQKMSADVTIHKSGLQEEEGEVEPPEPEPEPKKKWSLFGGGGDNTRYKYLSKSVRSAIDNAKVKKNRWKYIVVHNSGTRQGSAKAYENYHRRVRKMQNGLAYHFVLGNGKGAGLGEVEIGGRWTKQINGGHVASDYLNNIAIGICLTGDYNRDKVPQQQLDALEELLKYLRKRVGKVDGRLSIVKAHRHINPKPTDCPGDRFPYDWLKRKFG